MNRKHLIHALPAALLLSAAIWAAQASDQAAGRDRKSAGAMATCTYAITFHVSAPSTVPDGANLICKASITPRDAGHGNSRRAVVPADSTPGFATISGSSATCTVRLPLGFAAGEAAALSYEIDAFTAQGQAFRRTQRNIAVAYPETPAASRLSLDVNF